MLPEGLTTPVTARIKNKRAASPAEAVADVKDGSVVMVGGFGRGGVPEILIDALCDKGVKGLTIISNNTGTHETGIARLLKQGCVKKMICSFPFATESNVFRDLYNAGKVDLEVVPQGSLAERIRAGGAGLGGFLTPTGVGTELAQGKQILTVNGREYVLELPLRADVAIIRARQVDPRGNLTYRMAGRNFNPVMCTAADKVIVEAIEEVELGSLDPEVIITPGLYVTRYVVAGKYSSRV